jgi:hypothetical protein
MVRAWNLDKLTAKPSIQFNYPFASVWQTTHLERNLQQLPVSKKTFMIKFEPLQINTYRVNIQPGWHK